MTSPLSERLTAFQQRLSRPDVTRTLTLLGYGALILAALVFYGNVFGNEFVFDDEMIIVQNSLLRGARLFDLFQGSSTAGVGKSDLFYRPLQTLLYYIIFNVFGLSTPAFHALNVTLHAANAALLFALAQRLNFNKVFAFFATLIWVLDPIHTEAITYMSGTADPLYCFFSFSALLVVAPQFTVHRYLAASPLFLLALLSKEAAVSLPALALTTQFFFAAEKPRTANFLRCFPFLLTAALYFALRSAAIGGLHSFYQTPNIYSEHITVRIYTFLATLPSYLGLILWPAGLHMDRTFPVEFDPFNLATLGGCLLSLGAIVVLSLRDPRLKAFKWGILWAGFSYGLNSGILYPVNSLFLEHWLYLPTAGLYLGLAESLSAFSRKNEIAPFAKPIAGCVAFFIALVFGILTLEQNTIWQNPISFYGHAIASGAETSRVYNNLGMALAERGDVAAAKIQYEKALAISGDRSAEIRHNLALVILKAPDRDQHLEEARIDLLRAVAINPNFFQSYEMLAHLYLYMNDERDASRMQAKADELREHFHLGSDVYRQPYIQKGEP